MKEFIMLIGQILIITCIQTVTEIFVDSSKNPLQVKLIGIACAAGSFYLLVQFVFSYILKEIISVINLPM